jgi:hypothetical protein
MTDSESADDTKSWPTPFALDSREAPEPATSSRRRRLSEVGNGDGGGEPGESSTWDRLAVRGRRLGQPARRLRGGASDSEGPNAVAGQPGGVAESSPDGVSSAVPGSPSPVDPTTAVGVRSEAAPDGAAPTDAAAVPGGVASDGRGEAAPSATGPSGDVIPGPVASDRVWSEPVPSEPVPSEPVPSEPVPTVAAPPGAPGAPPPGWTPRRQRPPDLSGLEEMRTGGDEGRTPDWVARRIVESEAPGAAYELGKQRRWGRRKVTVLRSRTNRRLVRRIDTWTVFKVSLLFYLLMVIIVLVAGVATWSVAQHLGFIGDIQKSVRSLADDRTFVFRGAAALKWAALGGAALGLLGTLFNTVAAMLYNLLSDVVGGLQVIVVTEPD